MRIQRRFEYGGHLVTLMREEGPCDPEEAAAHCWFASIDGSDELHSIPVADCDDIREVIRRVEAWLDSAVFAPRGE